MNILWHLRPRYEAPGTSGANLRYWNFTREIAVRGHKVFYLIDDYLSGDSHLQESFLKRLQREVPVAGHYKLDSNSAPRGHLRQIKQILEDEAIDVYMVSVRGHLSLLRHLRPSVVTVVDWCDSEVLAHLRDLRFRVGNSRISGSAAIVRSLIRQLRNESIYGRRADLNLVVSPVDKRCLDRLAWAPSRTHVVRNGIRLAQDTASKWPNRLIFTGRMDFAPNYQSALWFIDRVLPLVRARRPEVEFAIVGADPVQELRARNSGLTRVPGFIEDLGAEIAASALYVAPMVCGSGFKNKVVEAIAHGTFVAGTSMAFEFLDREFRELLLCGDTPRELAAAILSFLGDPEKYTERLKKARLLTAETLSWGEQAERLLALFGAAVTGRERPILAAGGLGG